MRKLATLLSPLAVVLVVACSSKKEETPTPTPGIDASTPGCDQNPSAPGCEEDEDSGGGTDGGGGTDSGSDSAVAIDPALLAGAQWTGAGGTQAASHKITFSGGPTGGNVEGLTVTKPANSSCGPASIRTIKWTGTWSYSASSELLKVDVTDGSNRRTECADEALDDTTDVTLTEAGRDLLSSWLTGKVTKLTSSALVVTDTVEGNITFSR